MSNLPTFKVWSDTVGRLIISKCAKDIDNAKICCDACKRSKKNWICLDTFKELGILTLCSNGKWFNISKTALDRNFFDLSF